MKSVRIADVKTHVLESKLSQPFGWSFNRTDMRASCIVEITTEDGVTGWGECYGPARLNAAVVAAFRPLLIGEPALATDYLWQKIYNLFRDQGQKGLVITALSGVDIALWDLKGKHFEAPVHVLMGGPLRREVTAYATGTYRTDAGDPMRYVVDEVRGYVAEGFEAVKLKIGFDVEQDIALIRAVREAIGPRIGLMLDAMAAELVRDAAAPNAPDAKRYKAMAAAITARTARLR